MATTETACRSSPGCSNEQIGEMGKAELKIQTQLTGRIEQTKRTGQKETDETVDFKPDGINRYRLAWKTD